MKASVTRMTMVRIKVAKSELMFSTPILAKIAVSAAKTADKTAQACQEENTVMGLRCHNRLEAFDLHHCGRRRRLEQLDEVARRLLMRRLRRNLSLIHISEPTRRTPISYAVFC